MGEVVPFGKPRRKKQSSGRGLCNSGFHKWAIDQRKQFDVREGRLVTVRRCERCGEIKVSAD